MERDITRRYSFSGWQLNYQTRRLIKSNGDDIKITRSEFALMVAFLEAPRRVLSRAYLLKVTGTHEGASDRSIDVRVLRLRNKLGLDSTGAHIIQTERGQGYVLRVFVEVERGKVG
jgi:two-component system OmpR family response regulator